MKYYLVRIGSDGKHRVQGEFDLTKTTKLIIDDVTPVGEQQYILPQILLDKVTDTGITTTVQDFDNLFDYEKKPVEVKTDIDEMSMDEVK